MEGIVSFKNLAEMDGLIHGFSTRKFGNMRPGTLEAQKNTMDFLQALGAGYADIVRMEQVHGDNVEWVRQDQAGWRILHTDSLLTGEKDTFLSVLSADCLPVFLFDRRTKSCGTVHAGWRGVYALILKKAVKEMVGRGSQAKDIFAGVGPCIRECCYSVDNMRIKMFEEKFGVIGDFVKSKNNLSYLDLAGIAREQILSTGIPKENIEDCRICTYDNDQLFSFRREGEGFGEFIGVIARI